MSHPKCNFILISKKGYQLSRLSDAVGKLVFDAIGKYIHTTLYRQIIGTESSETLDTTEQERISKDQKHSSHVAKIHYWKKRSRDLALKGQQCLKKLKGQEGKMVVKQLMSLVSEDDEDASDPKDISITQNKIKDAEQSDDSSIFSIPLEAKTNNASSIHDTRFDEKPALRKQKPRLFFTPEEDIASRQGIRKYGFGNCQKMLNDKELQFQKVRIQGAYCFLLSYHGLPLATYCVMPDVAQG